MIDELQQKQTALFALVLREIGLTMHLTSTDRTPAQDWHAWLKSGGSRDAYPRQNGHLVGMAFDAVIETQHGFTVPTALVGRIGKRIGLRWGGTFARRDPVHFDLGLTKIRAAHTKLSAFADQTAGP